MNILAIDTAGSVLSLALAAGNDTWLFEAGAGLRHSELLMGGIDTLLDKAGLRPGDLSGVVCMGGPGSFTGLRIGFAAAKGLALALDIPFAPIPTLDCMAHPFACWPGLVIPALDAKQNAFFCALYRRGARLGPPMDAGSGEIAAAIARVRSDAPAGDAAPVFLTGPGAEPLYRELAPATPGVIRPEPGFRRGNAPSLLDIAKTSKILDNKRIDDFSGPEYIRKSDAELKC